MKLQEFEKLTVDEKLAFVVSFVEQEFNDILHWKPTL